MKIILSRNELLAALVFASSDGTRFTLTSVCVEVNAGCAKPTLIATDGRRLAVIQSQAEQAQEFTEHYQMLLRADFVYPICALSKAFGGKLFPWIEFESKPGSKRVSASFVGGKCFFEAEENALVEGAYPDWRKVVPDKHVSRTQMNDLGINAAYLADFVRAGKALDAKTTMIQMNLVGEESAIEVKIPGIDCFYALVMPCHVDKTVDYQPEFLGIMKDLPVKVPATPAKGKDSTAENADAAAGGRQPEVVNDSPGVSHHQGITTITFTPAALAKLPAVASALREYGFKPACDEDEDVIQQCIETIRAEQNASVSLIQRRWRLGYTRAARIMDELERRGIVGPAKGAEPRDILIGVPT